MPFYGIIDESDVDPTDPFPFVNKAEADENRDAVMGLYAEINILRRYLAAALDALDFAHSEGFEWPMDPLGYEALAFADPMTALERIASADTHPKDGDVQQAPLVSGAVPREDEADAQTLQPSGRNPE